MRFNSLIERVGMCNVYAYVSLIEYVRKCKVNAFRQPNALVCLKLMRFDNLIELVRMYKVNALWHYSSARRY